jgi:hypothetical protein
MVKKVLTLTMVMLILISFTSVTLAESEKKSFKAKGDIIYNAEKNYIKVLNSDRKTITVHLVEKTKYEAVVKAKLKDLARESEERSLPKGTVVYTIKDGKAVAQKVTYTGRQRALKWGILKKKKKK